MKKEMLSLFLIIASQTTSYSKASKKDLKKNNFFITFRTVELKNSIKEDIQYALSKIQQAKSAAEDTTLRDFYYSDKIQKDITTLMFMAINTLEEALSDQSYIQKNFGNIIDLQKAIDKTSNENKLKDVVENIKKLFILLLAL